MLKMGIFGCWNKNRSSACSSVSSSRRFLFAGYLDY
nr:MAG TPA: hypothetical protein [Caudoviricetes sp.]